jgi:hypothetical protein
MSNEGELWTRLVAQTTFRTTHHGEEQIITLEGVKQILNEAKREFPATIIWTILQPVLSDELLAQVMKEVRKPIDWSEKWLGDTPNE